jgi:uncharacterized small protein (DUF1192 family)
MNAEEIRQRIAELEQERADFRLKAHVQLAQQVGEYTGRIAALREVLEMLEGEGKEETDGV